MSNAMVADFTQRASLLSYEDTISVISLLLEKLKMLQPKANEMQPSFLDEMFAIAEKSPELHKSDEKWSRDELYRY